MAAGRRDAKYYVSRVDGEYRTDLEVVRVCEVNSELTHAVLQLVNGRHATWRGVGPFPYQVGTVLLIDVEDGHTEVASDHLWPSAPTVGVILHKSPDETVVYSNQGLQVVPSSTGDHEEGHTVVFDTHTGVTRVLARRPLRPLDTSPVGQATIDRYKVSPGLTVGPTFDDFGGLSDVVERAKELIEVPLTHSDKLRRIGARPIKGVLFTGLPGTGKTMLARIIANSSGATFYEISGPAIVSKWVGQSEELVRALFEDAAKQSRAIIFFDEIDSVAGKRSEVSHEASDRLVAQLLTEMDGFSPNDNVVVIATTNRPEDIDVALRRPGRFDWEIHFDRPTRADREHILRASSRKLRTVGELPHGDVADRTADWSAAELSAIWSEAALLAASEERDSIYAEDYYGALDRVARQRQRVGTAESGRAE